MHPEDGRRITDSTLNNFVFCVPFVVELANLGEMIGVRPRGLSHSAPGLTQLLEGPERNVWPVPWLE